MIPSIVAGLETKKLIFPFKELSLLGQSTRGLDARFKRSNFQPSFDSERKLRQLK